jgi:hypothetical protein
VEAIGAPSYQEHDVFEPFSTTIVDAEPDRREDPFPVVAQSPGELDERLESAALYLGDETIQEFFDLTGIEVSLEDRPARPRTSAWQWGQVSK